MSPSSAGSRPLSGGSNPPEPDRPSGALAGDGLVARVERAIAPFAERFAAAPAVRALREALPASFGVLVLALAAIVIATTHGDLAARIATLPKALPAGIPGAFAVASIAMVLILSTRLAVRLGYRLAPLVSCAVFAFVLALPREALVSFGAFGRTLGASGLFTAIVVSLATAGAVALGRARFGPIRGDVAGAAAIALVSLALYGLHLPLASGLGVLFAPLATLGDSWVALAVITAIEAALWLVGIHGPALLAPIVLPVYIGMQFDNTSAFHAHEPLPHIVAVSTFLFVFPGGAGATLPMVVLLLRSRVARLRRFALATLAPSLCNTNEPVMFGLPVVFNPVFAVPYILAPVALACTTYLAMALGWVNRPVYYVPSTIPVFVNVVLATLDWRAAVLVAVNLAIATAIWFPFVRVFERTAADPA